MAVPNAIQAGATSIGFHVELLSDVGELSSRGAPPPSFRLTISDNASGLDLHDPAHLGRGRARLAAELGAERLHTHVDDTGTRYSCLFEDSGTRRA